VLRSRPAPQPSFRPGHSVAARLSHTRPHLNTFQQALIRRMRTQGPGAASRDVQVHRWTRLLSWLQRHGMDLSSSAFRVERRPRAGIFPPFVLSKHTGLISRSRRRRLWTLPDQPVSGGLAHLLQHSAVHRVKKIATGFPLRCPTVGVGEREDACTNLPWLSTSQCPPAHLPTPLSA